MARYMDRLAREFSWKLNHGVTCCFRFIAGNEYIETAPFGNGKSVKLVEC